MTRRRYVQEVARRAGIADGWISQEEADGVVGQMVAAFVKNSSDGQVEVGSARLSLVMIR